MEYRLGAAAGHMDDVGGWHRYMSCAVRVGLMGGGLACMRTPSLLRPPNAKPTESSG